MLLLPENGNTCPQVIPTDGWLPLGGFDRHNVRTTVRLCKKKNLKKVRYSTLTLPRESASIGAHAKCLIPQGVLKMSVVAQLDAVITHLQDLRESAAKVDAGKLTTPATRVRVGLSSAQKALGEIRRNIQSLRD